MGVLLKSVTATLTQGLSQTPQPNLQLTDAQGNVFAWAHGANAAQVASTTVVYSWLPGVGNPTAVIGSLANCYAASMLPLATECFLPNGVVVGTKTIGIGANSQWGRSFCTAAVV